MPNINTIQETVATYLPQLSRRTTTPCQLVQPVALDAVGTVEVTVPTAVFKTMSDKPSK